MAVVINDVVPLDVSGTQNAAVYGLPWKHW